LLGSMRTSNSAKLGQLKKIRDFVLSAKLLFGGVRDAMRCIVYVELNFVIHVETSDAAVIIQNRGLHGSCLTLTLTSVPPLIPNYGEVQQVVVSPKEAVVTLVLDSPKNFSI